MEREREYFSEKDVIKKKFFLEEVYFGGPFGEGSMFCTHPFDINSLELIHVVANF